MISVTCLLLIDGIYSGGVCVVLALNVRSVLEIDLYIFLKLDYVSFCLVSEHICMCV